MILGQFEKITFLCAGLFDDEDRVSFPTPFVADVVIMVGSAGQGGDVSSGGSPQWPPLVPHQPN
jgi:hypothetical protein